MASEERLRELEDKYEGYTVYDNRGDKIGKVDDLFIDESDREEYIGVKMGFFGRKSTLIPMDIVRVNEADRALEVSESKDHVKDAPHFDDDEDVTPEYEERIRSHFGLQSQSSSSSRGFYTGTAAGAAAGTAAGTAAGAEEGRDTDRADSDREGSDRGYADSEDRAQAESTQGEQSSTGDEERSGSSTGDEERSGSSTGSSGATRETGDTEREGSSSGTSAAGPTGAAGRFERGGTADEGGTSQETTGGAPRTRQTEETETYEEGGRTKVRRRIIREEIVEEDA